MFDDVDDDLVSRAILRIAQQTRYLAPWTALPLASASIAVADMLQNLTGHTVHDVYFPFVRFSVLHAMRVSLAWAAMTRGRKSVGLFADLFGFLVIAWGGGTLVSLLLGNPPAWLISPVPWLVYVAVYLVTIPTRLASVISSAPSLPLGLVLSLVDGMTRGVSVASMPALTESSPKTAGSWLAPVVLGAIATCGGGWIAQTLGLARESWAMGRPSVLGGGVWNTLDVWAALIAGVAYSTLNGHYPALRKVRPLVAEALPDDLEITPGVARAVAVLIFAGLFAARTLAVYFQPAAKVAEQRIQAKAASLPSKAAALSEKIKADVTPIKAQTPEPETPRRSTRSSRAETPSTTSGTPAPGEDTPSKPRKRRAKKKATS
ncbi:hypothetical protein CcaverHIS002_0202470 [Cutaneotrichosporon cavernicola]|uniref:Uncharacterized protein n=1 Tax=Cutaneotrichosporon cavernicola TaxID=279322 RepID=A0AA48I3W6_9TREE|nr:uncharacterized protein CcaverHIS019_0202490 [Cutaneotrichosporon cavernicola]BEI81087.1 hypothetical protein CcaverHIS002_0202470 [Cutaneotrichosporon cavernicola]BEI88887.1 hypothetical protein CcaverHIS019_0202490 [Cutaneotrichosporon cavernicola]BEI96664.1 hypothetical protein CcaverHIS631_0202530 [Cutaneotrichosporon cavernicola]BEJ04435.1 hypothetical protein CcaverHIS641_0202520 [Cutaneotrichosporon cavernicola]